MPVIQKVLIAAKQKQSQDTLITILRSDIDLLTRIKDACRVKDSTNQEIINTYQAMTSTMQEQRKVLEGQIVYLNKEVKRWKRKTRWTAIAGLIVSGALTYLFITK